MKAPLLALLATGCQYLVGIESTKVRPDGPPADVQDIDAAIDAPPPPMVLIGDGADGPLNVTGIAYTDDVRTTLTQPVLASNSMLQVASAAGFFIGDEVLVMQMDGPNRGQYETTTVMSTLSTQILVGPLVNSYESSVQVIRVPNYSAVTIVDGGVLTGHAWDGATGGVVAFRVAGVFEIQVGGKLVADGLGFVAGDGGAGATGGAGGNPGGGGAKAACAIGCSQATPSIGADGGAGQLVDITGAPGQPGVNAGQYCRGGSGGRGGITRPNAVDGDPGVVGAGFGAGTLASQAGTNTTVTIRRPLFGGGGAGGDGGRSGGGAGGGGGGGGPGGQTSTNGVAGTVGASGGDGGNGGAGGRGAGVLIVHAQTLTLAGVVSARGIDGMPATNATDGGVGGDGGAAGSLSSLCSTNFLAAGRGGGGQGGNGGNGGSGGGGGGGGIVELNAFMLTVSGEAHATGGAGGTKGTKGLAGAGGAGWDDTNVDTDGSKPGAEGVDGIDGGAGGAGLFYLRYIDTCTGCDGFGAPAAVVEKL